MAYGWLTAFIALLATGASSEAELRARVAQAPKDVAAFVERRANCNHFLGEEPYDRERAAYLNRVIEELRCATLDRDEAALRRTYRGDAKALRLLDDTADLPGW